MARLRKPTSPSQRDPLGAILRRDQDKPRSGLNSFNNPFEKANLGQAEVLRESQRRPHDQSTSYQTNETASQVIEELTSELFRQEAQVQAIRRQWQGDVEDLESKLAKAKSVEFDLQAEIRHLREARHERERAGKGNLEEELFVKVHDTWRWMEEVRVVRDLRPFTRGQRHQPEALSGKVMQKALDTISTELQSIFHNRRSDMLPRIPIVRGHSDLASLLRYSFEGVTEPRELRKLLAEQISKWGLPMIIRGLTIAAIKEWVFTSDFPNFSRKGDPRLLQQYRKIIAKSDGSTRLHNLEMAAYHAMTEEERFNETNVPRKAEEFADRLSMALAPFFIQADGAPLNGTFASWGQDENQSLDRQFRFKEIFETALRLKAATVTTDETYDFILHPFGTLNKLQESRTGEVISRETRMAKGDLWLHASLVTYEAHPSSARDLFANALVQSNNFSPSCERTDPVRLHTEYLLTPMVLPGQRYGPHSVENNPQRPAAHNTIRTETSRDRTPLNQHRNIVGSKMRNEIPQRIPNSPQKRTHANAFPSSDLPPPLEPAAKRQAQAASSRDQRPAQIQAASPSCLPRSKDNDEVGEYEKTDDSDQAEAAKSLPSSKDHFRCPRCDTPFKTRKKLHSHEEKGKYTKDAV